MAWNGMNCLGLFLLCTVLFPIVNKAQGAGECKRYLGQRLLCYDCDSRYDPYCGDPFNYTLPQELRPMTKVCHGCCVKFVHRFPDGEWVQRSCTENIIINYFMVDHVCMGEGKGHGKMCFCESNLCNEASISFHSFTLILCLSMITSLVAGTHLLSSPVHLHPYHDYSDSIHPKISLPLSRS
ncbi:protein quiver isoform X1 [Folsomia candida]|uniref:protein quiver isoform X1 n=1 Tax=Folsomia candida TaxID=158441 RepID=UPI000B8FDEC8|nr:protein quiver isoform X1 [Folsomia candida]